MGCSRAAQPNSTNVETVSEFTKEQKIRRKLASRLGKDYQKKCTNYYQKIPGGHTYTLRSTVFLFQAFFSNVVYIYIYLRGSRDSVVGIATGYGLDDRGVGVRVPVGSRIFSTFRPAMGST
jgi:hypothetical protein